VPQLQSTKRLKKPGWENNISQPTFSIYMPHLKNLSSKIHYLPLNIQSRVELWLTYKNLKPTSLLIIRENKTKTTPIINWLKHANLTFIINPKDNNQIFISKKTKTCQTLFNIWETTTPKNEYQKGILLGYPEKAAKTFSLYSKHPNRKNYLTNINDPDFPKKEIIFYPYISYTLRKNHEIEDSQTAKIWADCIRKDLPKLAKWYESAITKSLK